MKQIKHNFSYPGLGKTPWVDLGGGGGGGGGEEAKNQLFQNMVMLHIKLKGIGMHQHGSQYFAH